MNRLNWNRLNPDEKLDRLAEGLASLQGKLEDLVIIIAARLGESDDNDDYGYAEDVEWREAT